MPPLPWLSLSLSHSHSLSLSLSLSLLVSDVVIMALKGA